MSTSAMPRGAAPTPSSTSALRAGSGSVCPSTTCSTSTFSAPLSSRGLFSFRSPITHAPYSDIRLFNDSHTSLRVSPRRAAHARQPPRHGIDTAVQDRVGGAAAADSALGPLLHGASSGESVMTPTPTPATRRARSERATGEGGAAVARRRARGCARRRVGAPGNACARAPRARGALRGNGWRGSAAAARRRWTRPTSNAPTHGGGGGVVHAVAAALAGAAAGAGRNGALALGRRPLAARALSAAAPPPHRIPAACARGRARRCVGASEHACARAQRACGAVRRGAWRGSAAAARRPWTRPTSATRRRMVAAAAAWCPRWRRRRHGLQLGAGRNSALALGRRPWETCGSAWSFARLVRRSWRSRARLQLGLAPGFARDCVVVAAAVAYDGGVLSSSSHLGAGRRRRRCV